jgi:hypothetical protein
MLAALRKVPRLYAILGLAAFLAYLPGSWWGAPTATAPDRKLSWGTDDETPLGPLAEVHNILQPKKDRNLGYPLMYSFTVAAAYAPYLGYQWATGGLQKISGEYPWGFTDPVTALKSLTFIAHLVSMLLGVAMVLSVLFAGRALGEPRAGLAGGLFMATAYPFFYYCRTGNVDGPMVAFVALAMAAYAALLGRGVTPLRGAALGMFMGFALGTKESCYSIFIPVVPILLFVHWRRRGPGTSPLSWAFLWPIVATAAAGVLAFGFGSGLFIEPSRYMAHLEFHRQLAQLLAEGNDNLAKMSAQNQGGVVGLAWAIISHAADTMSGPGLLLSAAGVVALAVRRRWAQLAAVAPALFFLALMPLHIPLSQLRYVLPAAPGLALAAGCAVGLAWTAGPWLRRGALAVAAVALSLNGLRAVDLTHAMIHDSRLEAGRWLAARLRDGDRIDYFGGTERLPPLPASVRTERAAPHMSARRIAPVGPEMQARIRQRWTENPPRFIVELPDHSSLGRPHHHTMPPATFAALEDGSLGYERLALIQTPPLLPWVRRPKLDYPMVNPPIRIWAPKGVEAP